MQSLHYMSEYISKCIKMISVSALSHHLEVCGGICGIYLLSVFASSYYYS